MILGSHNSWSYITPKKWYQRLFNFISKCQDLNIKEQYKQGVRCFDLRVRFNKKGKLIVAHGFTEYPIDKFKLINDIRWLNSKKDCFIRVIHEVRFKWQYTQVSKTKFQEFCSQIESKYSNIKYWGGRNLYNWEVDYMFHDNPECKELYSSVCPPYLIDDLYPRHYAAQHNRVNIQKYKDRNLILLIDFINLR